MSNVQNAQPDAHRAETAAVMVTSTAVTVVATKADTANRQIA
jgi:hypothetical protein